MSSDNTSESNVVASSTTNIKWFFIITLLYFTIKHIGGIFDFQGSLILFACYYLINFFIQITINIDNSKKICGSSQSVLWSSVVSWIGVFGGFLFMLLIFPGWNVPFSNSLGYSLCEFAGADMLLREVINSQIIPLNDESKKYENEFSEYQKKLYDLYTNDPSYLINEIPLDLNASGEWVFWEKDNLIDKKFKNLDDPNNIKIKNRLYNIIYIKESFGYFTWYMLVGILACLINFNYILTSDCIKSVEEINDDYATTSEQTNNETTTGENTTSYDVNNLEFDE